MAPNANLDNGSECQTKLITRNVRLRKTTLNAVTEKTWWLWTPSWKWTTLYVVSENGWWLWTPNDKETMRRGNMSQCSVPLQLSIFWEDIKETPWASRDALLASKNDQINYKHSLVTHSSGSRGLTRCHNEPDVFILKCSAGGIHCHLKWVIH